MAQTDKQTNRQTNGHGDSMTNPAQRAESVKTISVPKRKYQRGVSPAGCCDPNTVAVELTNCRRTLVP